MISTDKVITKYVGWNEWEVFYEKKIVGCIYWTRFNRWVALTGKTEHISFMKRLGDYATKEDAINAILKTTTE